MTPFEKAIQDVNEQKLQAPEVHYGKARVDYFGYQLAVHQFNLRIMAKGMKVRGMILADLKNYYGLTGRTAAACLPQFEAIMEAYKAANA